MKEVIRTTKFKKDWKREAKTFATLSDVFHPVFQLLVTGKPLPEKYRDHALTGILTGYRDCHLRPDLVLIYSVTETSVTLTRIGSHSELFG